MKFVIVCLRHMDFLFGGNAYLFWGPDKSGYTASLEAAGVYTLEEAKAIFGEDDVPIPISVLGLSETPQDTQDGLKVLEKITLWNRANESNKRYINLQRESFRKLLERDKTVV